MMALSVSYLNHSFSLEASTRKACVHDAKQDLELISFKKEKQARQCGHPRILLQCQTGFIFSLCVHASAFHGPDESTHMSFQGSVSTPRRTIVTWMMATLVCTQGVSSMTTAHRPWAMLAMIAFLYV